VNALLYLAEAGCGLALFLTAYRLFLRKETFFQLNRIYLVAAILVSFAAPALRLTSPFFTARDPVDPPPSIVSPTTVPAPGASPSSSAAVPRRAAAPPGIVPWISSADFLLVIYAAGVLVCLIRRALLLLRLARFVRRGPVIRSHGLKVVLIAEDLSPFSFLGYVFLNERDVGEEERLRILAHEAVHVRQLHSLDILLVELVAAIQWFNPFVGPYRKCLQETHEYLADAGVVAQGFGQAAYQLLLLERHVGAGSFEFANNFRQSQIKRRILMLSKRKSRGSARLKPLLALPLAAFLALAFADPRPAASATAPAGQERIAEGGKAAEVQRRLEDLRQEEIRLVRQFAETEDLRQKREILANLNEILRLEEDLLGFPPPGGGAPWTSEGLARERREAEFKAQSEASYRQFLAIQAEELVRELQKESLEAAARKDYERKLAQIRLILNDPQAKLRTFGEAYREMTLENPEARLRDLKRQEEELTAALKQTLDPPKKMEYERRLKEVRLIQEEIKVRIEKREVIKDIGPEAEWEKILDTLKRREAEIRSALKTETDPARRGELEKALEKTLAEEQDLHVRIEKRKRLEPEPLR
jgi:beta-lactamase regulating signal transducer with metallopeptidase domain